MGALRHLILAAAASVFALQAGAASTTPYSQLIFFGDSLSDNGNLASLTAGFYPADPYWEGRFSNGPVAAEYMAQSLELDLVDYAFAGAKTGQDAYGRDSVGWWIGFNGTGMKGQVGLFMADLNGAQADPNALYGVWGGPNDFAEGGMTIDRSVGNLAEIIVGLYSLGARNFFVPNMPDLGLTANHVGTSTEALYSYVSLGFNTYLSAGVDVLGQFLPDANFITFDTYAFMNSALGDPGQYGFANVTDACMDVAACVNDPQVQDGYLFWDGQHPTTAAHELLGNAFADRVLSEQLSSLAVVAAPVPEPGVWAMMLIGFGVIASRRRPYSS